MTRTGKLLAAGCFVLATVAACGSQAVSTGSGGTGGASLTVAPPATTPVPITTPPPVNTTTQPVPSQPRSPVPAGQIQTANVQPPPNAVSVTKDGRFVVFNAAQSGCEHVTAALSGQTTAAVTIQVRTTIVNHGGQVCPMIVRLVPLTVPLSSPLGSRHVVFEHVQAISSGN